MRRISKSLSRCITVLSQLTLLQLRITGLVITISMIVCLAQFVSPLLGRLSQSVVVVAVLGTILPMMGLVIVATLFASIEWSRHRISRARMYRDLEQIRHND